MGINTILPVNLVDFSVSKKENVAEIKCNATLDRESSFEILHSSHAVDFSTTDVIHEPTGSNGILNHYSFIDQSPVNDINYDRIAYSEANGVKLFTKIKTISFGVSSSLKLYPNPVTG